MSGEEKQPKRTGRPRKSPEKGKRQNYTFRMSDADRDLVVAAAEASGRSISEEIEYRVSRSFAPDPAKLYLEMQYNNLLESVGGLDHVFVACILCNLFKEAVDRARASNSEISDWATDPEMRALVSETMKEAVKNFVDTLSISGGAIKSYSSLFALNKRILEMTT